MATMTENEVLQTREQLFTTVDIMTDPINCGDDRASELERYIHLFGGELFVPYTTAVLQETDTTGSAQPLGALRSKLVAQQKARGVRGLGVHSDETAEQGSEIDLDKQAGPVGCGFAAKRAAISHLIHENREDIITEAEMLMPELFGEAWASEFAHGVADAHGRIAERSQLVVGDPRQIILDAVKDGDTTAIYRGGHTATVGIINTERNSSFLTGDAVEQEVAAYNHDLWASDQLFAMSDDAPNPAMAAIASLIDVIGTMKALGVTEIAVR